MTKKKKKKIHIEEATDIVKGAWYEQNFSLLFRIASFFCKNTVGETCRQLYIAGNKNVYFPTRTCTGLKGTILAVCTSEPFAILGLFDRNLLGKIYFLRVPHAALVFSHI